MRRAPAAPTATTTVLNLATPGAALAATSLQVSNRLALTIPNVAADVGLDDDALDAVLAAIGASRATPVIAISDAAEDDIAR